MRIAFMLLMTTIGWMVVYPVGLVAIDPPSASTERSEPVVERAVERSPSGTSESSQSAKAQEPKSASASDALNSEIEQATLEFVREHQPELAKLLEFLKDRKAKEYREAINESYKVRNRLRGIKDRDAELYEVELNLWKNAAQLRLLAASVAVRSKEKSLSDDNRDQLRKLLERENELTIQRLKIEKNRAEARLTQVSQQLSKRQEQSESYINKGLKSWENRIEKSKPKSKPKSSP